MHSFTQNVFDTIDFQLNLYETCRIMHYIYRKNPLNVSDAVANKTSNVA